MLASEREKLENRESSYVNIGISENGEEYGITPVFWKSTATAFNMCRPNVYISPNDLLDEEIMSLLQKFHVKGCYIYCAVNDYSFLNKFNDIYDLTIYNGANLKDLSFMKQLKECKLLTLVNTNLKNLDEIADFQNVYGWGNPRCLTLYNCEIDDINSLSNSKRYFSELIIYNPKNRDERERWKKVNASTFGYYELT